MDQARALTSLPSLFENSPLHCNAKPSIRWPRLGASDCADAVKRKYIILIAGDGIAVATSLA
jgi:hypothetical protein